MKILYMIDVSSKKSCCMNEMVEKGRIVQQSEDPCILDVESNVWYPLLGVYVDLFLLLHIPYFTNSLPIEYAELCKPT